MNNLKFRAWCNNKMYYVAGIMFATQQEGEPEWDNWGTPKQIELMAAPENSKLSWHDAEECFLMQSTGQFDVNGVEIFVGDIIECDYIKIGMDNKHPIKKQIEITSVEFDHFSKGGIVNLNVIGNIYEHSHLLDIT